MAFEFDTLTRRTVGPALAAAVIGLVVGIAAIAGVAALSEENNLSSQPPTTVTDPLLGGPEYGSRDGVS